MGAGVPTTSPHTCSTVKPVLAGPGGTHSHVLLGEPGTAAAPCSDWSPAGHGCHEKVDDELCVFLFKTVVMACVCVWQGAVGVFWNRTNNGVCLPWLPHCCADLRPMELVLLGASVFATVGGSGWRSDAAPTWDIWGHRQRDSPVQDVWEQ